MATVLTESGGFAVLAAGDALWLPARETEAATGWIAKPEGLCKGESC